MSIAAEYAARCAAADIRPPAFGSKDRRGNLRVSVTTEGDAYLNAGWLSPAEALRLADWIIDTFSDAPIEWRKDTGELSDEPCRHPMIVVGRCKECGKWLGPQP